jgi:hypothetical protein
MVFTGIDWHNEIPSTVDGTHALSVNSERAGEVAVRNEIDQGLASFGMGAEYCDSSDFTSNFASCVYAWLQESEKGSIFEQVSSSIFPRVSPSQRSVPCKNQTEFRLSKDNRSNDIDQGSP